MKNKDTQLLEEAYTKINEAKATNSAMLVNQLKDVLDQLVPLVRAGDKSIDIGKESSELNMIITDGLAALMKARRQYTASKVSPETRKAAAQKAKDTNAKWKAESEEWKAKRKGEVKNHEQRMDRGYLPTYLNDSKGTPNPEYYELETIDDDGYSIYSLKDEYVDVKVSDKRVPDSVLWVSSNSPRHSQQTIDRINAKKRASADSAWRTFASR